MLTEERVLALHDGTWQASRAGEGNILTFARAVEREATEALRRDNDALRALLDMARREQCQCRTCRAIRAALAKWEKPC